MRPAADPAMLATMAGEAPLVLRLELDAAGEAIQGRVTAESGLGHALRGLVGPGRRHRAGDIGRKYEGRTLMT